jgi:hypothetical protein
MTVVGRVGRTPAVALSADPAVDAAEVARFRSKIVAGPGDRDCSIWIGSDRLLFSVDYPYESMADAVEWFDNSLLSRNDRAKIGRENAQRIFNL